MLITLEIPASKKVGLISDLHLGPERPDIGHRFDECLKHWAIKLDVLIILGDLFEYWIGDDAASAARMTPYESMIRQFLESSSIPTFIMHGNRDFLIGDSFCQRTGARLIRDPCLLLYGSHRILLAHGDAYCTDDVEHMRTRPMLRSDTWQAEFLAKSTTARLQIADHARSTSEAGKQVKPMHVMDVADGAIVRALEDAGCRMMIHGHTHRPNVHQHTVGDTNGCRVVLSDWHDGFQPVELFGDKLSIDSGREGAREIMLDDYR